MVEQKAKSKSEVTQYTTTAYRYSRKICHWCKYATAKKELL